MTGNLYEHLFPGGAGRGEILLPVLSVANFQDVGRFRDIWIERNTAGEVRLHLYTRNGGGNRPGCEAEIAYLRGLPWFEHDADDTFDSTYASFWFLIPADSVLAEPLAAAAIEPVNTGKRWKHVLDNLRERPGARAAFIPQVD